MGSFEVTLLLAVTLLGAVAGEGKSNGFGTDIDWLSWEDMKSFDYKSNTKPIMYVFSKPWCGACKRLKAEFTGPEGGKITDMSKDFVMVSIADDVADQSFAPDGGYIPRVIFASPNGELRLDLKNTMGNPKYGYFYGTASEVRNGMFNAVRKLKGSAPKSEL